MFPVVKSAASVKAVQEALSHEEEENVDPLQEDAQERDERIATLSRRSAATKDATEREKRRKTVFFWSFAFASGHCLAHICNLCRWLGS